ncbi:MAG: PQQ-like beta-propeller repeat protein [Candidatus Coatesbacteria bacterium]|nr:PQQ-like beta-propeller repeat protein [Candidatus Coatesbacteria bacterium]
MGAGIVRNRVFLLSDKVYLLDMENGTEIWSYSSPFKNAGRTSPVYDDQLNRLFVVFDKGIIAALDFNNGSEIWLKSLSESPGCSPLLSKYFYVIAKDGKLYAFDKQNGNSIWVKTLEESSFSAGSLAINKKYLFAGYKKSINCLNPENGNLIWKSLPDVYMEGTFGAVDDSRFYSISSDKIIALDINNGSILWVFNLPTSNLTTTLTLHADNVLVNGFKIFALKRTTGQFVWSKNGYAAPYGPITVSNNIAYFGYLDGAGLSALKLPGNYTGKTWNFYRSDLANSSYLPE